MITNVCHVYYFQVIARYMMSYQRLPVSTTQQVEIIIIIIITIIIIIIITVMAPATRSK